MKILVRQWAEKLKVSNDACHAEGEDWKDKTRKQ